MARKGPRPRLIRPKEILLHPRRRFVLIPHFVMGLVVALGIFLDQESFVTPPFHILTDLAPTIVWGAAFALAGLIALWSIVTLSWRAYVVSNLMTLGLSLTILVARIDARVIHGLPVGGVQFGILSFVVATCLTISLMPTAVVGTR